MDLSMHEEFLIVLLLILANGLFAGTEMAIVAIRGSRVRELVEQGSRVGTSLERLRAQPERFLSTVQTGITLVGATAAAFSGASFAEEFVPWVERVPVLGRYAPQVSFAAVVALVSYLSIVLGELVPKSLALRSPEKVARLTARPLLGLSWLARPIVWILTSSSNLVLRMFGDQTSFTESRLSLAELRGLVDEASAEGSVPKEAGEIASRALEFAGLRASDVMIHRRFVVALSLDASEEVVRQVMLDKGHRRIPVHRGSNDDVAGYVSWRDLLRCVWERRPIDLEALMRPCHFVPESAPAPALLQTMRERRVQLAIVMDEHGGMAGIVTLEDLLEELVGEIVSEHDAVPVHIAQRQPDGSWIVAGSAAVRDVNRELDLRLEEDEEWTSLAGLCIQLAGGRIPTTGEVLSGGDGTRLEIALATERRVRSVRILPRAEESEGGANGA